MVAEIWAGLQAYWDPRYATAGASAVLTLVAVFSARGVFRAIARSRQAKPADERTTIDDVFTWFVALIATAISAEGSYRVFEPIIVADWLLWSTFAVIELGMLVNAFRARRHMRKFGTSGVDGIAAWVFAGLTAALASLHALGEGHPLEFLVRLAAPLLAAYLWERGMRLARTIRKGRKSINWTIGFERILVKLGLAEPEERDTTEVTTHRYLTQLAVKTVRLRTLETSPAGTPRRITWATNKQRTAMTNALEHTDFATNPQTRDKFLAIYGALVNASALTKVEPERFWEQQPKTESPYPTVVIPETVIMEPAPPVPVLAAANGNGHQASPKPAPKATTQPRNNDTRKAAYEIWQGQKDVSPKTVAEKTGANYKSVCRWIGQFNQGLVPN